MNELSGKREGQIPLYHKELEIQVVALEKASELLEERLIPVSRGKAESMDKDIGAEEVQLVSYAALVAGVAERVGKVARAIRGLLDRLEV